MGPGPWQGCPQCVPLSLFDDVLSLEDQDEEVEDEEEEIVNEDNDGSAQA